MVVFGLPLALPLFSAQAAEQNLPACCRRDGRHHCSMPKDGSQPNISIVGEKCPVAPASPAFLLHFSFTPGTAAAIFAGITCHPAISPQTEAQFRVSFDRARQKRGPPAFIA
jgi:hypothetical protein